MKTPGIVFATFITMVAFAGNSLLCRAALVQPLIDPASFTTLRLLAGAIVLQILVAIRSGKFRSDGTWVPAFALFSYAAGFSFAYTSLPASTGALLLFGAVQATMIGYALFKGERPGIWQFCGILLAMAGLVYLLLPGIGAPSLGGSLLMIGAGIAWGIYSLFGRQSAQPLANTAGNFLWAVPFTLLLSLLFADELHADLQGIVLAVCSGAITSGLGYGLWYLVLPQLRTTTAATVQLSVPALAALGGVLLLGEAITLRILLATCLILGGIGLYIRSRNPAQARVP